MNGDWSACSASCGGGSRTRSVFCTEENGNETTKLPDHKCSSTHKPHIQETCNTVSCPMWETDKWSEQIKGFSNNFVCALLKVRVNLSANANPDYGIITRWSTNARSKEASNCKTLFPSVALFDKLQRIMAFKGKAN
ncbi:ATL3 protein, partial [Acromyrmex insinuator]